MAEAAVKVDPVAAALAAYGGSSGPGAWAAAAQDAAAARVRAMGLPARRDEYWRFTNPASLVAHPCAPAALFHHDEAPVFDDVDRLSLVFVDGVFRADLSDDPTMDGVRISLLADAMDQGGHWASELYGSLEAAGQTPVPRPLAALNTATATQGVVIHATGAAPRPIECRYLHQDERSDVMVHHLVKVDAGASVTVLESGPAAARFNMVMEVDIADTGVFDHVRDQGRDHERQVATAIFARLGRESRFKSFTMTVNGVMTRNEAVIAFAGDDAQAHVAGAAVGDGNFHHDDTVFVTHDAVNCESRQVFKKVLRNGATGVFQGKILVQPDAQRTDGYQISQGLLLDDDSQFLAKPELEIYADDVACSHGSTVGSVDEDALFYLTSRGIPRRQAANMLVLAFLAEAMDEIADPAIAENLSSRLAGWMARRG